MIPALTERWENLSLSSRICKGKRETEAGLSRPSSYALEQVSSSPVQTPTEAVALPLLFVDVYRCGPISKKLSSVEGATS